MVIFLTAFFLFYFIIENVVEEKNEKQKLLKINFFLADSGWLRLINITFKVPSGF